MEVSRYALRKICLASVVALLAMLVGPMRPSIRTEEQILRAGGPAAEAVMEKAARMIEKASTASFVISQVDEGNWGLTVLLRYDRADRARQTFIRICRSPNSTIAGKVYAFAGLRLLQPAIGLHAESLFSASDLQRPLIFKCTPCTGSYFPAAETFEMLEREDCYQLFVHEDLPPLYEAN